jgi:drug/metabolite transporter (DMT)-like permease
MLIWLWVLVRIVANPFSNVFQKVLTRKAADPLFVICLPMLLLALACVPIYLGGHRVIQPSFWPAMVICAVLAVCGNVLLVQALKISDLSVLGPINAYKSVVSLLPGMILLHEFPRPIGIAGIGLILGGSYFLVDKQVNQPRRNLFVRFFADRGIRYRLAALLFSAVEAVFLKRALLASDALTTFALWSLLGAGASLLSVALLSDRRFASELRRARHNWRAYALLAATTGLMQLATLITFQSLQVGYSLALFQISTLLTVILGHRFFREGHFAERMIGSAVMVIGAVLIIISK